MKELMAATRTLPRKHLPWVAIGLLDDDCRILGFAQAPQARVGRTEPVSLPS